MESFEFYMMLNALGFIFLVFAIGIGVSIIQEEKIEKKDKLIFGLFSLFFLSVIIFAINTGNVDPNAPLSKEIFNILAASLTCSGLWNLKNKAKGNNSTLKSSFKIVSTLILIWTIVSALFGFNALRHANTLALSIASIGFFFLPIFVNQYLEKYKKMN
ncbi:hypothetical protein K7887_01810 [Sutcliffiella horikoshii]|uniref:hypothetical protein n=1 Tax=Sutcliffiella horikoshii TaxID=79883 RepID=UPI001CBC3C47|nr:hypothetical protein [Sutcliffiella horikoshii]UAL47737.1 hypothetical protein K7887_01810 [Sutcliffiella horikoshii]